MKFGVLLIVMIGLVSCSFESNHRGYVFPADMESTVMKYKTTDRLQREIGDPQARTVFGDEVWIYYSAEENMRGPLPTTYDDKTVLLVWVKNGNILKTKVLKDKDLQQVEISKEETQVPAEVELNAIEELFNNIGRFSPSGM